MEPTTATRVGTGTIKVVQNIQGNAPLIEAVDNRTEQWVKCGKNNLFREFLRALADNCAPMNSCVNTLGLYIAGKRLVFKDSKGDEVDAATAKWAELTMRHGEAAFRSRVAKDLALLGDRCVDVIYSKSGIAEVAHMDAMRLRSGKKDSAGRINEYFWCSNWEKTHKHSKDYPIIPLPAFGSDKMKEAGRGISFAMDYHQGQDYYGMPYYLPALTDAEVFSRIAEYNRVGIDTGFTPRFHLHLFTTKDNEDVKQLDENIEQVFTGADGKKYIFTYGTKEEGAPVFTPIKRGDEPGELDAMGDRSEMVIYKAFGIPPILMGVDVATGMSGKGLALEQSVTQFLRTVVEPRQKFITDFALQIIQLCGVAGVVECEVEQLNPFDAATDAALKRQSYLRSTTVNEDRMASGLGRLTVDGTPEKEGGVLDERGNLLLIQVGTGGGQAGEEEPKDEPKDPKTEKDLKKKKEQELKKQNEDA